MSTSFFLVDEELSVNSRDVVLVRLEQPVEGRRVDELAMHLAAFDVGIEATAGEAGFKVIYDSKKYVLSSLLNFVAQKVNTIDSINVARSPHCLYRYESADQGVTNISYELHGKASDRNILVSSVRQYLYRLGSDGDCLGRLFDVIDRQSDADNAGIYWDLYDCSDDIRNISVNKVKTISLLDVTVINFGDFTKIIFSFDPIYFGCYEAKNFREQIERVLSGEELLWPRLDTRGSPNLADKHRFFQLIKNNVESKLHEVFSVDRGVAYTWAQLLVRANAYKSEFLKTTRSTKFCAIFLCQSFEFAAAALGALLAGKTYVPLTKKFGDGKINYILTQLDIPIVVAGLSDLAGELPAKIADRVINPQSVHAVENMSFSPTLTNNNVLYRMFTSGSTGNPKAVDISFENYLALVDSYSKFLPDFELLNWAFTGSTVFDSSTKQYLFPLLCGTKMIVPQQGVDENVVRCIEEMLIHGADVLNMTPALIRVAIEAGCQINKFKYVLTGGEALTPELYSRILENCGSAKLLNMYGPTEATVNATGHIGELHRTFSTIPIGVPLNGANVAVVDAKLDLLPAGIKGELLLSGSLVASGYPGDSAKTKEKFVSINSQVWYRTGDIVVRWFDDNIYYLGRDDDQVKINGVRVELGEIKARLNEVNNLNLIDVICENNRVFVFYKIGSVSYSESDLRIAAHQVLPSFIRVSRFVPVVEVPLTVQGKTDRRALMKIAASKAPEVLSLDKFNEIEKNIFSVINHVIDKRWPGTTYLPDESLPDQGVDSLCLMEIIVSLEANYNLSASISGLHSARNLSEISEVLKSTDVVTSEEAGEGELSSLPTIILFPPVLGSSAVFKNILSDIDLTGIRVVRCDYPGIVNPGRRAKTINELAEKINMEVLERRIDGPVILLAYSMGCLVAAQFAHEARAVLDITKVILIDKGPFNDRELSSLESQIIQGRDYLNESLGLFSSPSQEIVDRLGEYVDHNVKISYTHDLSAVDKFPMSALCIRCTEGGSNFDEEDWRLWFPSLEKINVGCNHRQIVERPWSSQIVDLINIWIESPSGALS
jgi:amino acid adenylation domain-containing protein